MDAGVYFFPTDDGADITDVARATEERGLESLFVPEHSHIPATSTGFLDPAGRELPERYRRTYDPFVALGAAAAVTTSLRIGTAACIVPQRDVVLTAKAVATIDRLSKGRFVFGVGAGWNFEELRTHGVDPSQRVAILTEAVAAMSHIWANDKPEFHGKHVDFGPIWSWPKPVQQPRPPILIAGDSVHALKRVLEYGDGWLPTHRGQHDLKKCVHELRSRADALGRGRPSVTFIAGTVNHDVLDVCLESGVDRVLLPIVPGPLNAVADELDSCLRIWERVHG